ncbi:MAG: periplasmic protein TonB [Sphingomonadales bacterium]|jgi:protein TonB|nr:periplasmic protein TonB [Sphingomonadales bacterium]
MYANGFFEQQRRRHPASFALVVALHAAGFGALILAGSTQFLQPPETRTTIRDIVIPPDPPPIPEVAPPKAQPDRHDPVVTTVPPDRPPANDNNSTTAGPSDPVSTGGTQTGQGTAGTVRDPPRDPPPPVRREAQLDPRYARDLQPPYPAPELRAEHNGVVQIRLTIAPNGRVTAVERLSATSEHFWRATQRQALNRWRFRPATLDGRPVQGTKVMTVNFRIQDG